MGIDLTATSPGVRLTQIKSRVGIEDISVARDLDTVLGYFTWMILI
jgi:hypothetical protein